MKILYITPIGKMVDLHNDSSVDDHVIVDMDVIHRSVTNGILKEISDAEISLVADFVNDLQGISDFDLYLCDLTTQNPNVLYVAGRVEQFNKPIIYIRSNATSVPILLMVSVHPTLKNNQKISLWQDRQLRFCG